MDRRSFVFGSAAAATALKASFAQDAAYPTHAIMMINPFPPGGAADVVGRPLAAVMEPMVQKPVVIETKAGATRRERIDHHDGVGRIGRVLREGRLEGGRCGSRAEDEAASIHAVLPGLRRA